MLGTTPSLSPQQVFRDIRTLQPDDPPKKRLRLARAFYSFALALFPGKIAGSVGLAPFHDISLDKVDLLSGIAVIDLRIGDLVNLSIGQLFASFRVIQNRLFE